MTISFRAAHGGRRGEHEARALDYRFDHTAGAKASVWAAIQALSNLRLTPSGHE